MSQGVAAYAVLRWDRFLGRDAPIEEALTVKCVVATAETAEREVARLNSLVEGHDVMYFFQATRWIAEMPGGESE